MKLPGWVGFLTAHSVSGKGLIGLCFMCGEYVVKRCKGYASFPLLVCYAPMCTASRAKARCGAHSPQIKIGDFDWRGV